MKSDNLLTILVFAPHSAIWVHAFPEALVSEALQQANHRVIYITCGEAFKSYCICMHGLEQSASLNQKESVCKACNKNKEIIKENFDLKGYDIKEFITKEEENNVEEILHQTTIENFLELKIDGIEIGRTALYETLLHYKKSNLGFSEYEWLRYLNALRNTLLSFFASRRIIEQNNPDRILAYNSLYSVNRICLLIAEARGIPTYSLHAGYNLSNRLETMIISLSSTFKFNQNLKKNWSFYKNTPCSPESITVVTNHFLELFKGQHFLAYSSAKRNTVDIRDLFKVKNDQKLLVATMSSYDERFAAEVIGALPQHSNLIFANQIEWLKVLIEFVKQRDDLFLVIRVHPREFPNKRDPVRSQHSQLLEQVITNLPSNVKLNWPEDNISIYDLAEYTDLFLNAWSSVGEEMSLFGIPVLIYSDDLVLYPSDINYIGINQEDFLNKIDIALSDGWSFERIRFAYRWYALKFIHSIVDLSDSIRWNNRNLSKKGLFSKTLKYISNLRYRVNRKISLVLFNKSPSIDNSQSNIKDCKNRANKLIKSDLINQLIQSQKETILDLKKDDFKETTDLREETEAIKKELASLLTLKIDDTKTLTPLQKKMLQSIQTKEFSSP